MAFQPVPNTMRVAIEAFLHGQLIVNGLHFLGSAPVDQSSVDFVAETVGVWWADNLAINLSEEIGLNQVVATGLDSQNAPQATYQPPAPVNGSVLQDSLPTGSAFVVSLRSGLTGRSARGRNYVAGIPQNEESNSLVGATWAGLITGSYNSLRTSLAGFGWTMVVVSRVNEGVVRPVGVGFPITSIIYTDLALDSQRRRLPGRGR